MKASPSSLGFASEEVLVRGLLARDMAAYNWLYDHYAAALYGVVFRIVRSEEIAQDILQESFVKIWRKIDRYDATKGRLFTWMLNVARNTAIDALRAQKGQKIQEINPNVRSMQDEDQLPHRFDHLGIETSLDQLEPKYRELIDLIYFQGYTQSEAAEELDIPLGTVKTRVRTALSLLRKKLT